MVNPDHNGGSYTYQWVTGGGRVGRTDVALLDRLLDPRLMLLSWAYGVSPDLKPGQFSDLRKIAHAPGLFNRSGSAWCASPEKTPARHLTRAARVLACTCLLPPRLSPPSSPAGQHRRVGEVRRAGRLACPRLHRHGMELPIAPD